MRRLVVLALVASCHGASKAPKPGKVGATLGTVLEAENIAASGYITEAGSNVVAAPACAGSNYVPTWSGSGWLCSAQAGGGGSGTITAVYGGSGLAGSSTSGSATVYLAMPTTACGSGSDVNSINSLGSAVCNASVATIAAGSDLNCSTTNGSATCGLSNSGVSASTYTNSQISVNAQGIITAASSGVAGISGTGTSGDLLAWNGVSSVMNYAGSSATACSAGSGATGAALSAAGALTVACGADVTAMAAGGVANGISCSTSSGTATCVAGSASGCPSGDILENTTGTSSGWQCVAIPTSGVTASPTLTSGTVPVATGAAAVKNSLWTDSGSMGAYNGTALTVTSAGLLATAAGYTTASNIVSSGGYMQADLGVYSGNAGATGWFMSASNGGSLSCDYGQSATATCHLNANGSGEGTTASRNLQIDGGKGSASGQWCLVGNSGHVNSMSTALTATNISSCGTGSPAMATNSTDSGGAVTEGTTATGCTITFANTWTLVPFCTCSATTSGATPFAVGCAATATTLVIGNVAATGDVVSWHCSGETGGT